MRRLLHLSPRAGDGDAGPVIDTSGAIDDYLLVLH